MEQIVPRTGQKDTCMKFYDGKQSLYIETDVSEVGLGAGLLQLRDGKNFLHDETPDKKC